MPIIMKIINHSFCKADGQIQDNVSGMHALLVVASARHRPKRSPAGGQRCQEKCR